MSKVRHSHRQSRKPRGVKILDRDAADQRLARQLREERRQEALDEVRREQERLERRIAQEKVQPAMGAAAGAEYRSPVPEKPKPVTKPVNGTTAPVKKKTTAVPDDAPALKRRFPELPWEGNGGDYSRGSGAIGQARAMLREGYHIRKVVLFYGVGLKWLDDIPLDENGHGLSHQP